MQNATFLMHCELDLTVQERTGMFMDVAVWITLLRKQARMRGTVLAERSGVNRSTLWRWERGQVLPRETELRAVLRVLKATATQQKAVWAALAMARQAAAMVVGGRRKMLSDATRGDLLRAMRMRAGLSQADAAARVDVAGTTLLRWEKMERWPGGEQIQQLCYLYGANEAEYVALTCGELPDDAPSLANSNDWRRLYETLFPFEAQTSHYALYDLHYHMLLERIADAFSADAARGVEADLRIRYAEYLLFQGRFAEARLLLARAERLLTSDDAPRHAHSLILRAQDARKGGLRARAQCVPLLRQAVVLSERASVTVRTHAESELAMELSSVGNTDEGIALSRRSLQRAESSGDLLTWKMRLRDNIGNLLASGQGEAALNALPNFPTDTPLFLVQKWLTQAEALLLVGERGAAGEAFRTARGLSLQFGMIGYARKFQSALEKIA